MTQSSLSSVSPETNTPPKAFISYSWTSPGHQEQVRLWAERLLNDGIEVVIDIFDLKEGHDKYSFMERMVLDPGITHVLVICDKTYAEKADARKAGVGTESQIISSEVYDRVEQSKFIPIACEFSDTREPFLPVFLRNRVWIDFSSPEAANENWERLVRLLHGKPAHQKPLLGKPPAYITANAGSLASPAIGKFSSFRQALLSNSKGLALYRDDFLSACIEYADSLRVRVPPDPATAAQKVLEDCATLKGVRNHIIDWVLLESGVAAGDEFRDSLISLLENLREIKARPEEVRSWNDTWFEAESVFVYETFLYIVAALIRNQSFSVLRDVFTAHYIRPKSERYDESRFDSFGCFYGYSEMLRPVLGERLYSPAAELIKRQADRTDLPFSAVIQAELIILIFILANPGIRWFPQTLYYSSQTDFPFFIRATQHKHFLKLAAITGVSDADVLREAVKTGLERMRLNQHKGFAFLSRSIWECMNMNGLDSLK